MSSQKEFEKIEKVKSLDDVINFLKEAFVADTCKMIRLNELDLERMFKESVWFELSDSKRGTFHVALLGKKEGVVV